MKQDIENILTDILSGKDISSKKQSILEHWLLNPENKKQFNDYAQIRANVQLIHFLETCDKEQIWRQIEGKSVHSLQKKRSNQLFSPLMPYLKYVALFIIALGFSIFYLVSTKTNDTAIKQPVQSIQSFPTLTLSSGEIIKLASDNLNTSFKETETDIEVSQNVVKYIPTQDNILESPKVEKLNCIKVPRGTTFKVIMSDGTEVFLNSESEFIYPSSFNGSQRQVKLIGEAYFKVAKDTTRPFSVVTKEIKVVVTGTEFNVRTYANDYFATTLVSGGVDLYHGKDKFKLSPGKQCTLINQQVQLAEVDTELYTDWINEVFNFKNKTIESVLNDLARWYNFQIFYQNASIRNLHISAWFPRSAKLSEVISLLNKTHKMNLTLNGNTLFVKDNQ